MALCWYENKTKVNRYRKKITQQSVKHVYIFKTILKFKKKKFIVFKRHDYIYSFCFATRP